MPKNVSPGQTLGEMRNLTPEQLQELGARVIPLNQTIREEQIKTIPDFDILLSAFEGLHMVATDLGLTPGFDLGKIQAELYLKVTAPKTLQ